MMTKSKSDSGLLEQIKKGLQHMPAQRLQVLAEHLAVLKFSDRFRDRVLVKNGRNGDSQTTKNWPDAYVVGADGKVDGIEATRDKTIWQKHLREDLKKAADPDEHDLSGYVFVGGYPNEGPSAADVETWIAKFEQVGVPKDKVAILVGFALAEELRDARYAQIRRNFLGIPTKPKGFDAMSGLLTSEPGQDDFQATPDDFSNGRVGAPPLLDTVLDQLEQTGACLVRGHGAAGKTTLAQLVAHSERIAPSPSWILDLTNPAFDLSTALESMVEWAGKEVLFVIDNIHLDETAAKRIVEHWRSFLQPLGARLLLLGRKTSVESAGDLAGLKALQLRAGVIEMKAVVGRLCRREGVDPPDLSQEDVDNWAQIFGGSRDPDHVAVDLIAFTAAVISKLTFILRGDVRLRAEDAVEGVKARYLNRLTDDNERSDLLRLASLAYFEIPLHAELLAHRSDLSKSINTLGIVLMEQTGLEERKAYRLVHHALGDLLLKAAPEFDVGAELAAVAGLNPSVGVRIIRYRGGQPDKVAIETAMQESVRTDGWMTTVRDSYDLAGVIRYALRQEGQSAKALDDKLVAKGWLAALISRIRRLGGINVLAGQLAKSGLVGSLETIGRLAADPKSDVHQTLLLAYPSEVAALLRAHPQRDRVLASIKTDPWNGRQAKLPAETADVAVSAGLEFERLGRAELAMIPCLRVINTNDAKLWWRCDVSHLSHMLRLTGHPQPQTDQLIDTLDDAGWLEAVYRHGTLGPMCGGLMSMANHLPADQRCKLLTPHLTARVIEELKPEFWINHGFEEVQNRYAKWIPRTASRHDHGNRRWLADKFLSRPVCLLGSFVCLGGAVETPAIDWDPPLLERMFRGLQKSDETLLGMYELQFWVGLKTLAEQGHGPAAITAKEGERFLKALVGSEPPTSAAADIKAMLMGWLRARQAEAWVMR